MRAPTTFKLVRGFHEQTPIPKAAKRAGWSHRSAVVIDSHIPGEPEMQFDSTLFVQFLRSIDAVIAATNRRITVIDPKKGKKVELMSVEALHDFYQEIEAEDRDLPEAIIWYNEATEVGGGFPEKWYAVGGPEIYHDSFTFSVFTENDIFPAVVHAAEEISKSSNVRLTGIYEGKDGGR